LRVAPPLFQRRTNSEGSSYRFDPLVLRRIEKRNPVRGAPDPRQGPRGGRTGRGGRSPVLPVLGPAEPEDGDQRGLFGQYSPAGARERAGACLGHLLRRGCVSSPAGGADPAPAFVVL